MRPSCNRNIRWLWGESETMESCTANVVFATVARWICEYHPDKPSGGASAHPAACRSGEAPGSVRVQSI